MNIKRTSYSVFFLSLILMILTFQMILSTRATSDTITDGTDDVYRIDYSTSDYEQGDYCDEIDITSIEYSGQDVTINFAASIIGKNVCCFAYFFEDYDPQTSFFSDYFIWYMNFTELLSFDVLFLKFNDSSYLFEFWDGSGWTWDVLSASSIGSASGNQISATVPSIFTVPEGVTFYAWSYSWSDIFSYICYWDFAPDSFCPYYTADTSSTPEDKKGINPVVVATVIGASVAVAGGIFAAVIAHSHPEFFKKKFKKKKKSKTKEREIIEELKRAKETKESEKEDIGIEAKIIVKIFGNQTNVTVQVGEQARYYLIIENNQIKTISDVYIELNGPDNVDFSPKTKNIGTLLPGKPRTLKIKARSEIEGHYNINTLIKSNDSIIQEQPLVLNVISSKEKPIIKELGFLSEKIRIIEPKVEEAFKSEIEEYIKIKFIDIIYPPVVLRDEIFKAYCILSQDSTKNIKAEVNLNFKSEGQGLEETVLEKGIEKVISPHGCSLISFQVQANKTYEYSFVVSVQPIDSSYFVENLNIKSKNFKVEVLPLEESIETKELFESISGKYLLAQFKVIQSEEKPIQNELKGLLSQFGVNTIEQLVEILPESKELKRIIQIGQEIESAYKIMVNDFENLHKYYDFERLNVLLDDFLKILEKQTVITQETESLRMFQNKLHGKMLTRVLIRYKTILLNDYKKTQILRVLFKIKDSLGLSIGNYRDYLSL